MRAAFEQYNNDNDADTKKKCRILSMDVSGLFPAMSRENCMIAVKEMIMESNLKLRNFNWWEAAKYLHVMYDSQTLEDEGLSNVIPKRLKLSRRELTVNCLKAKTDDSWWIGDEPTDWQMKRMLALVLAAAVNITMSNHVFSVGDTIYISKKRADPLAWS